MNSRKRQASEPLLPLRSSKHHRTAGEGPTDGILSRWLILGQESWKLIFETVSYLLPEQGMSSPDIAALHHWNLLSEQSNPSRSPSPSPLSSPSPHTPNGILTPHLPSRSYRSPAPPPSTPAGPSVHRRRSTSSARYPPHQKSPSNSSPLSRTRRHRMSSTPPAASTPQRASSPHFPTSRYSPRTRKSMDPISFAPDPPQVPVISVTLFPHQAGLSNPPSHPKSIVPHSSLAAARSMPPPPPPPQPSASPPRRSDSRLTMNSNTTLPHSSASTLSMSRSSNFNHSYSQLGIAVDSVVRRNKLTESFNGIPRPYKNREHILAGTVMFSVAVLS